MGFAGDVHFERHLAALLGRPRTALGPTITAALRAPDLMMLNLETAITRRGQPEPKQYTFRTSAKAFGVLDALGIDVVSLANNHAADYGAVGLRDTLAAVRRSPVPVVGIGEDASGAFRAHTESIRGTTIAAIAATTVNDRTAAVWAATADEPGVAVALSPSPKLLQAVRKAAEQTDVVIVYLHWGTEYQPCPGRTQLAFARALSSAGADIVLGSHAHVLQGAGWLDDTYVAYGLGNFVWYNQNSVSTGILQLTIRDGEVVGDSFRPAHIRSDGRPHLVAGSQRTNALADWRELRNCTSLAAAPPP